MSGKQAKARRRAESLAGEASELTHEDGLPVLGGARAVGASGVLPESFPEGTTGDDPVDMVPAAVSGGSHPFPWERGTGERPLTAPRGVEDHVILTVEIDKERGTTRSLQYPTGSIPLPLHVKGQAAHIPSNSSTGDPLPAGNTSAFVRAPQRAACSWDRHDLTDILAGLQSGTLQQPQPTVAGWLYARAVNGLAGESGSGKTWTALVSVALELRAGNPVVYVDFEDGPIGIVGRLLALGVPADVIAELFIYVRPDEAFRDDVRAGFWQMLDTTRPTLVIIDSTGESMAIEGVDPNSDDGVARWFRSVATAIADRGPAVLLLDHLPKSDNAASSPIGSQRKRAAVSGVQVIQTVAKSMSFAKGRAGEAKLVCTKDRHGNFVTGEVVMRLIVNPEPARGEAGINAVLVHGAAEEFAHTRHMLNISQFIEQQGSPQTATAIKKAVTGKAETINAALAVLVASGYLSVAAGANRSKNYTLLKPYALGDPYTVPDVAAGCGHPWHDGNATCNPDWCHPHHHGRCNERVARGYVLDADGDVIEEPIRHGAAGDTDSPDSNLHNVNPWDSD